MRGKISSSKAGGWRGQGQGAGGGRRQGGGDSGRAGREIKREGEGMKERVRERQYKYCPKIFPILASKNNPKSQKQLQS